MELMGKDTLSLICRDLGLYEVVRLRQVSKKLKILLDSERMASNLLPHFSRLQAVQREGRTFAELARCWSMLEVSTKSFQAFFAFSENTEVASIAWAGGDAIVVGCQKELETTLHHWDMQLGAGVQRATLGTFFPTEMECVGQQLVIWSGEACVAFDQETDELFEFAGPTSNIVDNQIATTDTKKRAFLIYDLGNLKHPVEEIEARLPAGLLMQGQITLASDVVILRTAGYRLTYDRNTGKVLHDEKVAHAQVHMTSMGLAIIEGADAKRVWRFHGKRLVMKLKDPEIRAVVCDSMVVKHEVNKVVHESLFDRKGMFLGHLKQRYEVYASDGVRLAAASEGAVHFYHITSAGVEYTGGADISGKPTALAFTVHYLVVGLKSGDLLRFPLVESSPIVKRNLKGLIKVFKR